MLLRHGALNIQTIETRPIVRNQQVVSLETEGRNGATTLIEDFMIIRGGENIYPREVEEFLYSHPAVREVQVIGVPDAKYGEEVCAWITLREGQAATVEELRDFCRGQIATCKIPRYIRFTAEFPTTVTGKIQKFRMREISIAELGLGAASSVQTA